MLHKEEHKMEITLEMVDQVRERTGASYEAARAALEKANGNVVDAIVIIEKGDGSSAASDIVEKIKAAVQKGNVNRIRVLRGEEELVNIPVNAGIAGGVLGLMAGPWVVISAAVIGAVAKFGFDCRFQLVKEDGTIDEIGKDE
ncbi:MAG: DUF4342 domain-containing protein [Ruminococcaceae bacterium]|nr:DUF4342 domain-containing protein [Oscillospiraceae bacterium]